MEKDKSLPPTSNSSLQQESDTTYPPSTPLKFANCNDTLKPESPSLSGDYYKTRNRLLDNTSVQSFEETLYLGVSQSDICTNNKTAGAPNEVVEHNDQQTVESEVTKIAEEW